MRLQNISLPFLLIFFVCATSAFAADRPNIVYILADDMGYGDISSLNENSKIPTPNIDRIAKEGRIFTDAHSGSGVCSPTRYGILTGRYSWRTRMNYGVVWGYSRPLIETTRVTVASLLKDKGYNTACIGKWHLGMDMATKDGRGVDATGENVDTRAFIGDIDWDRCIEGGPTALGFDYYFGISASLDMHPYIYIENDRFVGAGTATKDFYLRGTNPGPAGEDFEAVDVMPDLTRKTVEYIEAQSDNTPFFVYMPLTAPHIPIVPAEDFRGRSPLGDYGDFVLQVDHSIGEVLNALDRKGFRDDTLVIFTSDNGGAHYVGVAAMESEHGHYTNYIYRG
jgi:arylsulfatase A-like enzyme